MKSFEHQLSKHPHPEAEDVAYCTVCGGINGSLPTLCPGHALTGDELTAVYKGELNFASGPMTSAQWWRKA